MLLHFYITILKSQRGQLTPLTPQLRRPWQDWPQTNKLRSFLFEKVNSPRLTNSLNMLKEYKRPCLNNEHFRIWAIQQKRNARKSSLFE